MSLVAKIEEEECSKSFEENEPLIIPPRNRDFPFCIKFFTTIICVNAVSAFTGQIIFYVHYFIRWSQALTIFEKMHPGNIDLDSMVKLICIAIPLEAILLLTLLTFVVWLDIKTTEKTLGIKPPNCISLALLACSVSVTSMAFHVYCYFLHQMVIHNIILHFKGGECVFNYGTEAVWGAGGLDQMNCGME